MLRGYQKRVIYLKNTGSEIFKEAYFVLEDEKDTSNISKKEMVDEANRIIEESFYYKKSGKFKRFIPIVTFFLGVILTLSVFLIYLF
jgi:hypothetical protein